MSYRLSEAPRCCVATCRHPEVSERAVWQRPLCRTSTVFVTTNILVVIPQIAGVLDSPTDVYPFTSSAMGFPTPILNSLRRQKRPIIWASLWHCRKNSYSRGRNVPSSILPLAYSQRAVPTGKEATGPLRTSSVDLKNEVGVGVLIRSLEQVPPVGNDIHSKISFSLLGPFEERGLRT